MHFKFPGNLFQCLANVEAFIDFGEEENIEEGIMNEGIRVHVFVNRKVLGVYKDVRKDRVVIVEGLDFEVI